MLINFSLARPCVQKVQKLSHGRVSSKLKAAALSPFAGIALPLGDACVHSALAALKTPFLVAPLFIGRLAGKRFVSSLNKRSPRHALLSQMAFHVVRSLASLTLLTVSALAIPTIPFLVLMPRIVTKTHDKLGLNRLFKTAIPHSPAKSTPAKSANLDKARFKAGANAKAEPQKTTPIKHGQSAPSLPISRSSLPAEKGDSKPVKNLPSGNTPVRSLSLLVSLLEAEEKKALAAKLQLNQSSAPIPSRLPAVDHAANEPAKQHIPDPLPPESSNPPVSQIVPAIQSSKKGVKVVPPEGHIDRQPLSQEDKAIAKQRGLVNRLNQLAEAAAQPKKENPDTSTPPVMSSHVEATPAMQFELPISSVVKDSHLPSISISDDAAPSASEKEIPKPKQFDQPPLTAKKAASRKEKNSKLDQPNPTAQEDKSLQVESLPILQGLPQDVPSTKIESQQPPASSAESSAALQKLEKKMAELEKMFQDQQKKAETSAQKKTDTSEMDQAKPALLIPSPIVPIETNKASSTPAPLGATSDARPADKSDEVSVARQANFIKKLRRQHGEGGSSKSDPTTPNENGPPLQGRNNPPAGKTAEISEKSAANKETAKQQKFVSMLKTGGQG